MRIIFTALGMHFIPSSGQSSGYSQSASLLAHNRITASQFIRRRLHSSWYKQVLTHCLLLSAIEAGDLLDSVKIIIYIQSNFFRRYILSSMIPILTNTNNKIKFTGRYSLITSPSNAIPEMLPTKNICEISSHIFLYRFIDSTIIAVANE